MAASTGLITTEQYLALPADYEPNGNEIRAELIAGEIVVAPLPSRQHDLLKNRIGKTLMIFLETQRQLGLESLIEMGFAVSDMDAFAPDVCVIKKSRLADESSRVLTGGPEIAVEVVSPSDTAIRLKHKISAYLANGSNSVWVVYPEDQSIEVHAKGSVREFKSSQLIEDETLPGFSQPVASFFEDI